jgi:hypothetical protein
MTADEIIAEIKPLGSQAYKNIVTKHGVREPFFGVKVEDLKKIQKRVKHDYQLALDLYETGIYDAMYLAGLIADDSRMTKKDLQRWAEKAYCYPLSEYTVAWVAAESPHGLEMARKWIDAKQEGIAASGWSTLSSLVAIRDDDDLDLDLLAELLGRVRDSIHKQPNRVRYTMNGFVIAVGSYVRSLNSLAVQVGKAIGAVTVNMGDTACKVPYAPDYIKKVQDRGAIGKKRKTAKC